MRLMVLLMLMLWVYNPLALEHYQSWLHLLLQKPEEIRMRHRNVTQPAILLGICNRWA